MKRGDFWFWFFFVLGAAIVFIEFVLVLLRVI
jgi:hypothetical protein